MKRQHLLDAPRMQSAVEEMKQLITGAYPQTAFALFEGDDPDGLYLRATVDVADTDDVVNVFIDRLIDLQVEEQLPLYVIPVRPLHRVLAELGTPVLKMRAGTLQGVNLGPNPG